MWVLLPVPASAPEDVKVQELNSSTALVQWKAPSEKDLNGDLKGFKVLVEVNETENMNFTLEPSVHSLILNNVSTSNVYTVKVGAYNRQGMGPFSSNLTFKMSAKGDSDQLVPHPVPGGISPVGSFSLIVQEVWFVVMSSVLVVLLLLVFVTAVCLKRKKALLKNQLGHYNGKHTHLSN